MADQITGQDFRIIFESLPGLYLVLLPDHPKFTIIAVSDAYTHKTNTKREEILGKGIFEVFPDNSSDSAATGVQNLKASLHRVVQDQNSDKMGVQRYDIRLSETEGGEFEERYWNPVNSPVFDSTGKMSYIIHQVEDVTKLQICREELQESEAQLSFALGASGIGSWTFSPDNRKVWHSLQHDQIFGYQNLLPEWSYSLFLEHVLEEDRKKVDEVYQHALATKTNYNFECRIRRKDGAIRWIEVEGKVNIENNQAVFYSGFVKDITEKKLQEQESEKLIQNTLRINELLDKIIENCPAGIALYRGETAIVEVINSFARQIIPFEIEEGRPAFEKTPAELAPQLLSEYKKVLSSGVPLHATNVRRGDKYYSFVRVRVRVSEKEYGVLTLGHDTTEQVKFLQDLEERIEKRTTDIYKAHLFVNTVLENIPNMIFVKDAVDLRFIRFNKAGEDLLGYSREDLLGKNDYDFFPKEEADFFTSNDRKVLSSREILLIPEEPIHTKHYGDRLLRTKKIPVFDKEGNPQYLVGISEDITDIKRLNEERERAEIILKSAERINTLIQNSLDAVVGMNDQGEITSWNSQAEKIFGWEKKNAIGRNLANLIIPPQFREAHHKGLEKYLSTGVGPILNQRIEISALRRGEVEFPVELTIIPLQDNPGQVFYAFIRDISDQKIFEQQQKDLLEEEHHAREVAEQTVNMQDDFLSIAAHELKTPITPIFMQLQLLEHTLVKGAETEFPSLIKQKLLKQTQNSKKEIDRLSSLVDELLDVSRISIGRLNLNLEEVNLGNIVQSQIDRHQTASLRAGSVLQGQIEANLIGDWDPFRLESLVSNLLTNAIKYGNGKPIEVKVGKREEFAVLTVKDHGIGISKEDQQRIFKKFERAASVKDYSGMGLGLYISNEIVKAHGGSIKLESEPQQGSTFVVELPLRQLN